MIRLLWRFLILAALAAGFAWLADRPGTLTIRWLGREISMSFIAGVAITMAIVVVLWFLWSLLSRLWRSPPGAPELAPCQAASEPESPPPTM